MTRRKLPIGIQTFREIRTDDCYYVDKTAFILRLTRKGKHYFLSRPRRFGKSLLLDTIKELFEGSEELFRGLHVHDHWEWSKSRPVVRLDFGAGDYREPALLEASVMEQLAAIERRAGITPEYRTAPGRLAYLLEALHERSGQRAAVLVDEYDKPILDVLEHKETARANRSYLRGLYATIKTCDAHVEFTLLTGVSKFSMASVLSGGLDNLIDITLDPRYAAICGYTEADLDTVFAPELPGLDREEIRDWYNGYDWRRDDRVYNPFDILLLFDRREFAAHWFETGTPSFLIDTLIERGVASPELDGMLAGGDLLSAFDVDEIEPEALLFQTGYLTIRSVEHSARGPRYRLGYPNREVRLALNERLLRALAPAAARRLAQDTALERLLAANDFTRATTSRATRATTRASATPGLRPWGWTSRWRIRAAAGGSTWRCGTGATSICSSSRWWSWSLRARRWRSCGRAATRRSTALPGRTDPPARSGVQPRDAHHRRLRGGPRLTPRPGAGVVEAGGLPSH